jgi:hypothetical protein
VARRGRKSWTRAPVHQTQHHPPHARGRGVTRWGSSASQPPVEFRPGTRHSHRVGGEAPARRGQGAATPRGCPRAPPAPVAPARAAAQQRWLLTATGGGHSPPPARPAFHSLPPCSAEQRLCAEKAWRKSIPYLLGESKLVVLQLQLTADPMQCRTFCSYSSGPCSQQVGLSLFPAAEAAYLLRRTHLGLREISIPIALEPAHSK